MLVDNRWAAVSRTAEPPFGHARQQRNRRDDWAMRISKKKERKRAGNARGQSVSQLPAKQT